MMRMGRMRERLRREKGYIRCWRRYMMKEEDRGKHNNEEKEK
jgi:hypothetical protein